MSFLCYTKLYILLCLHSHDADDEFVSESYQGATKKEMAEVNESMRRLGLGGGGGREHVKYVFNILVLSNILLGKS